MVSFHSLNTFMIHYVKSLSSESELWAFSGTVSVDSSFSYVWVILSYFFLSLEMFWSKTENFK